MLERSVTGPQSSLADRKNRNRFAAYARRLATVDRGIRRGTPIGDWFKIPFTSY